MTTPKTTLREDVVKNAVYHQIQQLEERAAPPAGLTTLLNPELNRDLITWPRQYLEPFLDSDESGRVPLTSEQLQDVLEAAFCRDDALAVEFLEEIKAGKEPGTFPERGLLGGAELPAQVQSALRELRPEARIVPALTDSGAYRGSVIAETTQSLIQRISRQSAVIHQKDDLDRVPRIGEYVCISYTEGLGHVTLVRERSRGKELAR